MKWYFHFLNFENKIFFFKFEKKKNVYIYIYFVK
jgi:hypothetical protein